MELRPITMEELSLYEGLATDPVTMSELGGPLPREGLEEKLRGIVRDVEAGDVWFFTIVPDGDTGPVGTVCVWEHEREGERIAEIGWMVQPAFQGRGLASAAVDEVLRRARSEHCWGVIHAFPGVTNGASNAICRKNGFTRLEELEVEYVGRPMRVVHWKVDVR